MAEAVKRKSHKERAADLAESAKSWLHTARGRNDEANAQLADDANTAFNNAYYAFDACTANGGRDARCSALRRKGHRYMAEGSAALKQAIAQLARD